MGKGTTTDMAGAEGEVRCSSLLRAPGKCSLRTILKRDKDNRTRVGLGMAGVAAEVVGEAGTVEAEVATTAITNGSRQNELRLCVGV